MNNYKIATFGYFIVAILSIIIAFKSENWFVVITMGIWAELFLVVWNTLIRKLKGNERLMALIIIYLIFTIGIRIIGAFKL